MNLPVKNADCERFVAAFDGRVTCELEWNRALLTMTLTSGADGLTENAGPENGGPK